jgi:hypothetical protein
MALSVGAVSALTSRMLKKLHHAVTHQAGTNSSVASGDVIVTFDASDNYEPKITTLTEAMGGATPAEVAAAADVSARLVSIPDATTYTALVANSGKPHVLPNLTGSCTITLPTPASGLEYAFYYKGVAADAQDWVITTGSNTNYFVGGLLHADTNSDAGGDEIVAIAGNGSSNSKLTVVTPHVGTWVKCVSDGTLWILSGVAVSNTVPSFADQ